MYITSTKGNTGNNGTRGSGVKCSSPSSYGSIGNCGSTGNNGTRGSGRKCSSPSS